MLYKNISDQPVFILQNMYKTLIRPGETVNLNDHDIRHSGSDMRFFESLAKHKIVKENGWHKTDSNIPIVETEKKESDIPVEEVMEKNLLSDNK